MEGEIMGVILRDICKSYNGRVLFDNFNIEFEEGSRSCIVGPSGCGKSTLLKMIAGVVNPDSGTISGVEDKRFSYIFQEHRLLPWLTVRDNIGLVLSDSLPKGERRALADELISKVELGGYAHYYPAQLSGGMKQRVSIARAFACKSDIILMDEPLVGLDSALKQNMIEWFTSIWEQDRRTVIFVTHDLSEAELFADRIVAL